MPPGVFMAFSEGLDRCLRTSLPMLLAAMTVFSFSLASSQSHANGVVPMTGAQASLNATELARFGQNDLLLGSRDPFFWFLTPLFGVMGFGICVWINYAALLITRVLSMARDAVVWAMTPPLHHDQRKAPLPPVTPSTLRRRLTIALVLLLMVSTVIPYQFAYMVACIVQLATCVRALSAARETQSPRAGSAGGSRGNGSSSSSSGAAAAAAAENFYHYAHSLLVLMLCVLPINIPVFVVWVHNLAVHWLTPFASHHNVLSIAPFVVLVETLTAGTMIPRVTGR